MLTGAASTRSKMVIPPGTQTVLARIRLSGNFRVSNAKFTSEAVDEKIAALSRRAQGRPGDESIQDVPANLAGSFSLANANLSFSTLQFECRDQLRR
jgi:hypothetical protein